MASGYNSTIYIPNQNGQSSQYKVTFSVTESNDPINIRSYVTMSATISSNGSTWQGTEKTMEILWNGAVIGSTGLTSLLSGQSHTAQGSFYVYHNASSGAASGTIAINIHSGSGYYSAPANGTFSAGTANLTTLSIPILPTSSLTYSDVKPTQVTIKSTTTGSIFYVKKNASPTLSQLITNYPDLPLMVLDDGSVWARIFNHDNKAGSVLWSSSEVLDTQQTDKYSRLNILGDNLKNSSGKFEFLLRYPTNDSTSYNRWRQTNAPQNEKLAETSTGGTVTGYEAVSIAWTGNYWGGLEYCNGGYTLLDGSARHSNWWYAIGSYQAFENGIPGPAVVCYRQTELWVRIPNIVGSAIATNANANTTVTDLDPETDYLFCSSAKNNVGYGFSIVETITTPTDQARAYVKKDGIWVKGKLYIKKDGVWVKSKKVYIKKTNSWSIGINN